MFICNKCGLCCMKVNNSSIYAELDRGDGICKYLDEKTKLCKIYNNRPILCNIDKMYEQFFYKKLSKEDYYKLNYEACKKIKKLSKTYL